MSLDDLTQVLRQFPPIEDPNVLIGPDTCDDVGAYRLDDRTAIVMSTDFFAPVVDDPYWFGAIAAANSLSDLYAKGVQPRLALNLVGFPVKTLPLQILTRILQGGAEKTREAGVVIIGGHSVDDVEPKYGLAVVGFAHPDEIIANSGAQIGDVLVLTKPLGLGIITTGIKRDLVDEACVHDVTQLMAFLNRSAAEAMTDVGVHAATDVTGYGLLGHLREVVVASGVGARVFVDQVPVLPVTWGLVEQNAVPGGTRKNHQFLNDFVTWDSRVDQSAQLVLCDAQTSGGLLISVKQELADRLLTRLQECGTPVAVVIGEIIESPSNLIQVV